MMWQQYCASTDAVACVCLRQTGDAAPYQYLVESIRQFATQGELADIMRVRRVRGV